MYAFPELSYFPSRRGGVLAGRVHLDTGLDCLVGGRRDRRLESRLNPQAGKPAPRSADVLVGGCWGLSNPQLRTGSRCTWLNAAHILHFSFFILHLSFPGLWPIFTTR